MKITQKAKFTKYRGYWIAQCEVTNEHSITAVYFRVQSNPIADAPVLGSPDAFGNEDEAKNWIDRKEGVNNSPGHKHHPGCGHT